MAIVNSTNCEEFEAHNFSTEASLLRLAPGYWPQALTCSLGNTNDLLIISLDDYKAVYRQIGGCITVTVFND